VTPAPQRRRFLAIVTEALGALLAAAAGLPLLGAAAHPLNRRRPPTISGGDQPLPLGVEVKEVGAGEPVRIELRATRRDAWVRQDRVKLGACWLVREGERVRALSTVCPHLGCAVDWNGGEGRFECPCHDSRFDRAGRRLSGPSPRDMDDLETRIVEGQLQVVYRRFRIGSGKREVIG
jgi:cytochrome b6-f complex iron-sulfur subunit/menaquinol-cytochrome c reductase iron-sulfur subunit